MKFPISWLNDYLDVKDISAAEYAAEMTMSGSKVEGVENKGDEIDKVVVGKVLSVEKHPNADSLVVCKIEVGAGEVLQIVTGATNVTAGAFVPVALHGSRLPGGINIKKGKLRGEVSEGMLCSFNELGLSQEDVPYADPNGILLLQGEPKPGEDIKNIFELDEDVVEFEITSNRPDCFSVIGLARETAATFKKPLSIKTPVVKGGGADVNTLASVEVKDADLCPRYVARVVTDVKIAPSPKWMQDRLKLSGIRAINNIVDITNYVLLEYGQPMHAFNLADLEDGKIVVRRAKAGEKIVTLDEIERDLDPSMLMICDKEKPVCVAGVMGGLNSEITEDTKALLFESANFDASTTRLTAKKLGLRTEASARYEKGLDPNILVDAVNRACELVEQLGAGTVCEGIIDVNNYKGEIKTIPFNAAKINAFLGTDISEEFMVDALSRLDIKVDGGVAVIPTFRPDLIGEADIAEEVVRLYGYNKIESTALRGETTHGIKTFTQRLEDKIHSLLVAQGLYEAQTFSFTSKKALALLNGGYEENMVVISNPLGEENSVMRTTLMASVLSTLSVNYNHRNATAKMYEFANVYIPVEGEKLPNECKKITLGLYGADADFYVLKGIIENLVAELKIKNVVYNQVSDKATFHPGRCAEILSGNKVLGVMGEVHPDVSDNFEIGTRVYMCELDFNTIAELYNEDVKFKSLPKFPSVSRDIAVIVDKDINVWEIEKIIRSCSGAILEEVKLFDVYMGQQVPDGKKSVAYSITYRAEDRTLTDEDVTKVFDATLEKLKNNLNAILR